MKLKNRLTALVAVAAIAVPAVVYAAHGKFSKKGGSDSVVSVKGFAPGISFDAVAKDNAISIDDDGSTIKVSIDGHKMSTDSELRDKHMKKQVFGKGKTIVLSVSHADLDAMKGGKVKGTLKFSDKPPASVTIEGVSIKDGVVKGNFKTTRSALQIPEACMEPVGIPCVKDELEVTATLKVNP